MRSRAKRKLTIPDERETSPTVCYLYLFRVSFQQPNRHRTNEASEGNGAVPVRPECDNRSLPSKAVAPAELLNNPITHIHTPRGREREGCTVCRAVSRRFVSRPLFLW